MKIKLSDIKIIPLLDTLRIADISDDVYFSNKYSEYTSNSRLKYIDPKDGGSPDEYKRNHEFSTPSLKIGSAIHECLLQPESFKLLPNMGKPNAKLGEVAEKAYIYHKEGMSLEDAIRKACVEVHYYVNLIDKKIPMIIEKSTDFWNKLDEPRSKEVGVEEILLSDPDYNIVSGCLESCNNNKTIMSKLHPLNSKGEAVESYNEIAFFIDFLFVYKNQPPKYVKFKMKADNFTINVLDKKIVLNDLKTTGKPINWFMNTEYGSLVHYSYYRQLGLYMWMLYLYCSRKYGATKEAGWKYEANFLVVQTFDDYASKCFNLSKDWLNVGLLEGQNLLKRIAAYKMFGWDSKIEFE